MLDGTLCGFEIKADNDDLSRLRAQARAARPRFRRLVLVVGRRHFEKAVEQVPWWWGVWLASPDLDSPTGVVLTVEREALDNPRFNRLAQAKLLQKAELRPLLTRHAIDLRGTNDTRNALAQAAADQLSVGVVEAEILHALAVRRCDAAEPSSRNKCRHAGRSAQGCAPQPDGRRQPLQDASEWTQPGLASGHRGAVLSLSDRPAPRLRSGKWHAHRKDLRDQRMKRVVLLVALGASLGLPTAAVADGGPVGATARCRDGTYSFSQHHQGACSHHRGVAEWLDGSAASSQSPTRRAAPTTSARVAVGVTVLLARRTKSAGCTLGPNPDRRCSPGAYYSKLTKCRDLLPGVPDEFDPECPRVGEVRRRARVRDEARALRKFVGDRPHR